MARTVAMILAGGKGKRMDLLCHVRPKPALPFAGRFRVIDFSLTNCIHSQIEDVAVLIDYQRSHMATYLRHWSRLNAGNCDFKVLEPRSGSYHGTADAVYQNLDYLNKCDAGNVLILAGDHVYKMDYRKMLAFHEQARADITIGAVEVPIEEARRFGVLITGTGGRVTDFVEKPKNPQSNLASMGIYIFKKEILVKRLTEDANEVNSPHDFGYAVIPGLVTRDRVYAYKFTGYWEDIGTPDAFYAANLELTHRKPSISLDGPWPVLTEDIDTGSTRVSPGANIINSLVSPGCVIKGRVENSILSPGIWVEEGALVKDSVLMEGVFVGYHSTVDRCILDEGVNIGKFCYIGIGTPLVPGNWDITVVGKNVTVPAHTTIGRDCKILPYVNADDFPTNTIPPGTVLAPHITSRSTKEKMAASEGESLHAP